MAAKNNSATIIDWLDSRKKDLIVMSSNARIQSMEPEKAKEAIDQFFAGWGRYETMFVVGLDGKSIATNDNQPLDLSERDYVKEALTDKIVISQPVFSQATGNLIMVIASPVKSDGKIVGVAGATVPMTYIAQLMSSAALGNTGEAYLINSEGYFITPSRYEENLVKEGRITNRAELELQIDTYAS